MYSRNRMRPSSVIRQRVWAGCGKPFNLDEAGLMEDLKVPAEVAVGQRRIPEVGEEKPFGVVDERGHDSEPLRERRVQACHMRTAPSCRRSVAYWSAS